MPNPGKASISLVFLLVLGFLLGNTGCQRGPESSGYGMPRFFNHSVTVWLSFDPTTGKATAVRDPLPISVGAREYPEWRPASGTPDFEIDFIDAPADKCVNKPKPSKKLPKPKCIKGKSCYTIRPTNDHYGCHAYVITLHRDPSQGGDVKTDPEIEVDR